MSALLQIIEGSESVDIQPAPPGLSQSLFSLWGCRRRLYDVLKECQTGEPESKVHNPVNSAIDCVFERSKGKAKGGTNYVSIQAENILESFKLLKITFPLIVKISCVESCPVLSL